MASCACVMKKNIAQQIIHCNTIFKYTLFFNFILNSEVCTEIDSGSHWVRFTLIRTTSNILKQIILMGHYKQLPPPAAPAQALSCTAWFPAQG